MSAHDITLSRLDGLERSVLLDLIERNDTSLSNLSCTDAVLELAASKAVDIAHSHWQSLFAGFSAQDGKRMAKEAVSQMPKSDARSLTYGEVDFFSFAIILELAETSAGSLFVDIGHGTGRAVLAAAMLRGHHFRECRGVELLKPLVAASLEAQGRFDALVAAHPRLYGAADGKPRSIVTMLEGDLLAAHAEGSDDQGVADALSPDGAWTEGDLVFANSTCFSRELMEGVSRRASELKKGALIVTLTQSLEGNPDLELTAKRQLSMSWGAATAFFHVRK